MTNVRRAGSIYLDDYEKLTLEDIRRMVGGRPKLRKTAAVTVHLADGRDVFVELVRTPSNVGGGQVPWLKCPVEGCLRKGRSLRIVPDHPGLMCSGCMGRIYGATYLCQQRALVGELGSS